MKQILAALLLTIFLATGAKAQTSVAAPDHPELIARTMVVEPSSAHVPLGKAKLIVSPLHRKAKAYVGDYQVKVSPYFFKNEEGTFVLEASDDAVRKLSKGIPVEFTGKATNSANGKVRPVKGKATPSDNDQGAATFTIMGDYGEMVFNTSYHFAK